MPSQQLPRSICVQKGGMCILCLPTRQCTCQAGCCLPQRAGAPGHEALQSRPHHSAGHLTLCGIPGPHTSPQHSSWNTPLAHKNTASHVWLAHTQLLLRAVNCPKLYCWDQLGFQHQSSDHSKCMDCAAHFVVHRLPSSTLPGGKTLPRQAVAKSDRPGVADLVRLASLHHQ